ncbi:MAG: hypothetical protein AA931_04980 [Peptococcaceae bacterium 1109]|jgi:uroporphyrinogen decarboxylase|nr:MAG: hypothetical protein AA931_04980 [Peptococcaceae bacterium 1109]
MTGRERLLNSIWNKPVDRRAVSPFIYKNFVKAFFQDPDVDVIQGTIDVYRHFGFDLMHRNINVRGDDVHVEGPNWRVVVKEQDSRGERVITTQVETPERILTQVKSVKQLTKYHSVSATVEYLIKDRTDFDQFVKYQPPVPKLALDELRRAKELIGDEGITAPWISGVFNTLADYRKLDDLLVDALMDPGFFHAMARYFQGRLLEYTREILDEGVDALSYAGNIATGTMVGPHFFQRYILELEKEVIDEIQGKGTAVLYHNCGDARSLFEVYNELGFRAYESIAEPPYGDSTLKDAIERFAEHITLLGNIDQIDFLRTATPEEVKEKGEQILTLAEKRPSFILGTTDFLEEGTPHANLFALSSSVSQN